MRGRIEELGQICAVQDHLRLAGGNSPVTDEELACGFGNKDDAAYPRQCRTKDQIRFPVGGFRGDLDD